MESNIRPSKCIRRNSPPETTIFRCWRLEHDLFIEYLLTDGRKKHTHTNRSKTNTFSQNLNLNSCKTLSFQKDFSVQGLNGGGNPNRFTNLKSYIRYTTKLLYIAKENICVVGVPRRTGKNKIKYNSR